MRVFVTVGTTSFDQLIQTVTKDKCIEVLRKKGFSEMVLQIGRGCEPSFSSHANMKLSWFRLKDCIKEEFQQADLVISHAGAGSCLEALSENKPLLIVTNDTLMGNHQTELADKLHTEECAYQSTVINLIQVLDTAHFESLKKFPSGQPSLFANYLDSLMDVG
uniref:UDP-N-acetylglucosamine transferase subunit ALG13 n=1 Tax=Lynceus sp. MCZ IZ 141354 TaxID=1930659 RepID=A0A9N6WRT5_9CRUS|nr:EOG090X0KOU [Lynceus sp. MCZ IZ 141354]